jgi:hypothetical protein
MVIATRHPPPRVVHQKIPLNMSAASIQPIKFFINYSTELLMRALGSLSAAGIEPASRNRTCKSRASGLRGRESWITSRCLSRISIYHALESVAASITYRGWHFIGRAVSHQWLISVPAQSFGILIGFVYWRQRDWPTCLCIGKRFADS